MSCVFCRVKLLKITVPGNICNLYLPQLNNVVDPLRLAGSEASEVWGVKRSVTVRSLPR